MSATIQYKTPQLSGAAKNITVMPIVSTTTRDLCRFTHFSQCPCRVRYQSSSQIAHIRPEWPVAHVLFGPPKQFCLSKLFCRVSLYLPAAIVLQATSRPPLWFTDAAAQWSPSPSSSKLSLATPATNTSYS